MAMALSQAMPVGARLPPVAAGQPQQAAGASSSSPSGLCMRRAFSGRTLSSAVAARGLLGLPVVKGRRGRVLCAVVDDSGDESGSDKEEDGKEISSVDGAASSTTVDGAASSTVEPDVSDLRFSVLLGFRILSGRFLERIGRFAL